MRYAIITNPASGQMVADQKRTALLPAAQILGAEIHGLNTTTPEQFIQCARELAAHCDVLVAAGGDGTLSDIINACDTSRMCIAYLPLGSGNAFRHALGYEGSLTAIAHRILKSKTREYDLISCNGKRRAFTASLGFEGAVIRLRDHYVANGMTGIKAYGKALFDAYFMTYKRTHAEIVVDGETSGVHDLLSLMVVKQPYYGYGLKVVPQACFDDGFLHTLCTNAGLFLSLVGLAGAFSLGNRIGQYRRGRHVRVKLERPLMLQIDGSFAWEADAFTFEVLPKALKIKC